jgi:hypothetical protein
MNTTVVTTVGGQTIRIAASILTDEAEVLRSAWQHERLCNIKTAMMTRAAELTAIADALVAAADAVASVTIQHDRRPAH